MLTSAVFSDMSKALDSVYHETLTLKLQDACASKPVIQWFCNYPYDRRQVVRIYSKHCQSPNPLTAAFRRDVNSDHFYLAYTLIFSFSTTEMQRPELCIRH